MGAYVSTQNCAAHHGIIPNCSITLSSDGSEVVGLGESTPGRFQGDPDIAGIGVLGAFISVTVFALFMSIVSTLWWSTKNIFKPELRLTRQEKEQKDWKLSISGILESLIATCSDQQVFTGGAYAITLRYAKACTVSAYHYNVVANILLVTCATHLMAATVSRHYWEHLYVGALRMVVTTLVFIITGVLLSNQGSGSLGFPTEVPLFTETSSLMLLPAACFQSGDFLFGDEIERTLQAGSLDAFFGGQIHGWTNFLVMFLFYLVAVFISLGRLIRRGIGQKGWRNTFATSLEKTFPPLFRAKRFFYALFGLYLAAGIAISCWTVIVAGLYVFQLRRWVDQSIWIDRSRNTNPENDPSTFGQLVPMLLMSLTVFTFLTIISERIHARRNRNRCDDTAVLTIGPGNPHDDDHESGSGSGHYSDKGKATNIGIAIAESDVHAEPLVEIPLDNHRSPSGGGSSGASTRHNIPVTASSSRSAGMDYPRSEPTAVDTRSSPHGSRKHSEAGTPYLPPVGSFSSPLVMNTNPNTSTSTNINTNPNASGWHSPLGSEGWWWQSPGQAGAGRSDENWFGTPPLLLSRGHEPPGHLPGSVSMSSSPPPPVPRKSPSREFAAQRGYSYTEGHPRPDGVRSGQGDGRDGMGTGLGLAGRGLNRTF
ncbi:TRP C-terminal domain-containing protein [Madurella fahalii]|uniref:TRP C-terminal domain-containing protein n=1 Tax=Madurella fahalii TaxID=1157608 RepID=A0ABQ0GCQ6_9PEZI